MTQELVAIEIIEELDVQPTPIAIVAGHPLLKLPHDLYIPPEAMEVFLTTFSGPLDLLLYLIKKNNLDILDIPIAEITRQYVSYIELMSNMQLELAAEYLVMAATLAEIKSRMLLPRVNHEEEEHDPRAELVRRLQEYERFKSAAENIEQLPRLERDIYLSQAALPDFKKERPHPPVNFQELIMAFKDVMQRLDLQAHHYIQREPLSIRERMTTILLRLRSENFIEFIHLFTKEEGRQGVVVTFIAILELLRESLIRIVQQEPFAPIHIKAVEA